MGFTLLYLCLIVLVPLCYAAAQDGRRSSWAAIWNTITDPRVVASYRLSSARRSSPRWSTPCSASLVAWVLVRYDFPGRRIVDALIDLPFALPTAVAGIALDGALRAERLAGRPLDGSASRSPTRRSA